MTTFESATSKTSDRWFLIGGITCSLLLAYSVIAHVAAEQYFHAAFEGFVLVLGVIMAVASWRELAAPCSTHAGNPTPPSGAQPGK